MKTALTGILALCLSLASMPALAETTISPEGLQAQLQQGEAPIIIDVRSEEEYLAGHIPNARLIPHDQIDGYLETLEPYKSRDIVVYCHSGTRADKAVQKLEEAGFQQVIQLEGSFKAWQESGGKVVTP